MSWHIVSDVTITPTDPEGSAADEHLRAGAGLLSGALDTLVEEILDSCDGATASSAEATGVADDISRGVERLGASVSDSTTAMEAIRVDSAAATEDAVAALGEVRADVDRFSADIDSLVESVAGMRT